MVLEGRIVQFLSLVYQRYRGILLHAGSRRSRGMATCADSEKAVRELLFKRPFDEKYPIFSGKLIGPVEVISCNGVVPTPFSDARLTLKYHGGGFLCGLFSVQLLWLYKILADDVKDEDGITDSFKNFFSNQKHTKCLKLLRDMKKKSHVQAVLASHLFGPLAAKDYIIDKNGFDKELRKCPGCDVKINLGDTSFGNKDTWYGHADIIVDRSTVEVGMSVTCEGESDELKDDDVEYDGSGEPAKKKPKLCSTDNASDEGRTDNASDEGRTDNASDEGRTDNASDESSDMEYVNSGSSENIIEVKRTLFGSNPLYQALAQTITNAFLQVKVSPSFSNNFIPSFLATEKFIKIQMYCCSNDLLLVSEELPLFESDSDDINLSTLIFLWLTLNTDLPAQNLGLMGRKQSKLRDFVKKFDKYSCYTEGIVQPLNLHPAEEKQVLEPCPLYKFPGFDMLMTEAQKVYTKANKTYFDGKYS